MRILECYFLVKEMLSYFPFRLFILGACLQQESVCKNNNAVLAVDYEFETTKRVHIQGALFPRCAKEDAKWARRCRWPVALATWRTNSCT